MRVNETIRISVFGRPGTSHLQGIEVRAEQAVELGMISAIPTFSVERGKLKGFWVIVIQCKTEDRPFWWGFYQAHNWCVNNRQLTVGLNQ